MVYVWRIQRGGGWTWEWRFDGVTVPRVDEVEEAVTECGSKRLTYSFFDK